ncbi:hypothetical protein ABFS83_04G104900 [Erythranthe nasuta]
MASCSFPFPTTVNHHQHHLAPPPNSNSMATTTTKSNTPCYSFPSTMNLHRSFSIKRSSWLGRCHAATGPQSEPPPEKNPPPPSGITAPFSRFQDSMQIFLAVLFWMSLFFWSCAWDGGNGGRPNNGSRFRK